MGQGRFDDLGHSIKDGLEIQNSIVSYGHEAHLGFM